MDLLIMSKNLDKFSKQLDIIQDYITLKFGVDFQEFYKSHSELQEDTDGFENATDLNLVVATTSGNNYLRNNANATRRSMRKRKGTTVNTRSQDHTHKSASNSSIPEVLLERIDVKKEEDFFDEIFETSEDNINDDDPRDQDFIARDAAEGSSAYEYCDRKRKRADNIIAEPDEPVDYGVRYEKTLRGQEKLIYQNYSYTLKKSNPNTGRSFWTCVKKCPARLKLASSTSKPEVTIAHIHDPERIYTDWSIVEIDGKKKLILENNTYRVFKTTRTKSGGTFWQCIRKSCTGRLKQTSVDNIKEYLPHNHDPPADAGTELEVQEPLENVIL